MSRYDRHDGQNESEERTNAPEVLEGIDPGASLQPVVEELPYISKSRVKTFLQCEAKFYWKYWCGERAPTNYYMEKGTRLHETFETFHRNLIDYVAEREQRPARFTDLLPHYSNYTQWIQQFGSFIKFEERRWDEARSNSKLPVETWLPVEVEAEAWLGEPPQSWVIENGEPDYVSGDPPVGEAPWMGRADLIAATNSVPGVEGDGVTIIDYKTGGVPDEEYREEGIFTEGEFYSMLFDAFYDIDALAGYYPREDELIISPCPDEGRRSLIKECVVAMQEVPESVEGNGPPENYDYEPQPLCNYNGGNCFYYNICPSQW